MPYIKKICEDYSILNILQIHLHKIPEKIHPKQDQIHLLNDLMLQDKQYQTTIKFGIRTDTGDKTGTIIEKQRTKLNEKQVNYKQ